MPGGLPPFAFQTVPAIAVAWSGARRLGEILAEWLAQGRAPVVTDRGVRGAGLLDPAVARARDFMTEMERLMDASGAPRRLRDVTVTDNALALLASDAMKQGRLPVNNPVEVTEADALALYREAF